MNEWYYTKEDTQKGPISEEKLNELIASGNVGLDDLAWKEGMSEWKRIGEISELSSPPPGPPPLPRGTRQTATQRRWIYLIAVTVAIIAAVLWAVVELNLFESGHISVALVINEEAGEIGYIDREGAMLVDLLAYDKEGSDHLALPSEGLVSVRMGGKLGYVRIEDGSVAIPARYDKATPFSDGFAAVAIGEKFGYIDRDGEWIVEPSFDRAYPFSEGLAAVEANKKVGFIDETGRMQIEAGFDVLSKKGPSSTKTYNPSYQFSHGLVVLREKEAGYGYVNTKGEWAIPPQFDRASPFSEGLAAVFIAERAGYIDTSGKWIVEPRYESAGPFQEERAAVQTGEKFGYINPRGQMVIQPQFDGAGPFSDGLAGVEVDSTFGYIDYRGEWVIEPSFRGGGSSFTHGRAVWWSASDSTFGYIDEAGTYVIAPRFNLAYPFGTTAREMYLAQ